jgi:dTDP-4-dehydrorhamnose reductase
MRLSDLAGLPGSVSHAVVLLGDTKPESCAADIQQSHAVNVESIKSVLGQLSAWGVKPVFTSTESVFDGTQGGYAESDTPYPILTYGRQKVEIEEYLQERFEEFLIARLALTFGSLPGDGTIFTGWLDSIEAEETVRCAYDQVCSPIHIDDLVEALVRLIELDCNGIFHVAGPKAHSKLQLFQILLAELGDDLSVEPKVVPCSIHDFKVLEKRPLNVSMRPDKLVDATGVNISDVHAACREMVRSRFTPSDRDGFSKAVAREN